jgi:thiamine-monophosphate kinase
MERELVQWLRERLPQNDHVVVGPGDDAAVLRPTPGMETVVTTDMLMDGVDFILAECGPGWAGRKALAVNLSDLAAMGARPVAAFVSLALPRSASLALAQALYEGIISAAERFNMAIAGGDTNSWDGPLCINVTAVGEVPSGKALLRSGARPGDALVVTGRLGGSILGHHFHFNPRIKVALKLASQYTIHAAMDISDGLSLDVWRMAQESRCGVVLDLAKIPVSEAAVELSQQRADGQTPLDHALSDGEDFELLLALSPDEAERLLKDQPIGVPLTIIGRFIETPGLFAIDETGIERPLIPRGYEHGGGSNM